MASSDKSDRTEFYFLQPQLLTKEGLIELLELRCVQLRNIHTMSKDELVEVFHRVGVPLPQRTYKDNRRGKLLTKLRSKQEKLREKEKPVEKSSNVTIGFNDASTSRNQDLRSSGDRLKPPPDAINFERKKIKLTSIVSVKSNDLDNIQIKKIKRDDIRNGNCLNDESHKKPISTSEQLDKSRSNSCTNASEKSSHKIVLKRPHSSSVEKDNSSDGGTVSKKEKKKITWP
ncbi:ashwin [Anabrus simplex]|uniref:ashwin n=1 Tax=Anabrus simplex TaxID=316456 RepID=UPI0034DD9003